MRIEAGDPILPVAGQVANDLAARHRVGHQGEVPQVERLDHGRQILGECVVVIPVPRIVGARQHGTREVLAGGVDEFLEKLSGRIGAIHLIDSDGTLHGDETSTHRPFGEGFINFKSLAPQLLSVPNIEWWCIDMCFWAGSWELVESSRDFVADLLGQKAAA